MRPGSSTSQSSPLHSDPGTGKNATTPLRVLFVVEGNTDIRFLSGLDARVDLTLLIPGDCLESSGLADRIRARGLRTRVAALRGGRARFPFLAFGWIRTHARSYDVVLAQEALRGAAAANLALGRQSDPPVITHSGIPALEYFQCKRDRGQVTALKYLLGKTVIRGLLAYNGKRSTRMIGVGPHNQEALRPFHPTPLCQPCYGVDTSTYTPVARQTKTALRRQLQLPASDFLVLHASRITHEKDPETVILALARLREQGIPATLLHLSGEWRGFEALSRHLLGNQPPWILARPAAHPMLELHLHYQSADAVAQASRAEGAGITPLEGMACGVPVVATAVGGLAAILAGQARLVPPGNPMSFAQALQEIWKHPVQARHEALRGRVFVKRQWEAEPGFDMLVEQLMDAIRSPRKT